MKLIALACFAALALLTGVALAASSDNAESGGADPVGLVQGPLPDDPESAETDYAIEGPLSPATVARCREDRRAMGSDPLMCEMAIGVADGTISPGSFTEQQLRDDLAG